MSEHASHDLSPALEVLSGAPVAWAGRPELARDGLAWLVALPGPPRRTVLADAWPDRVRVQLSAACVEPSWGAGAAREPHALASAEAILLGWWCQAETVMVDRGLLEEAWAGADERMGADPDLIDSELPPAVCFVPAEATDAGYVAAPAALPSGPPHRLLVVLVVRDRPSLTHWEAEVAGLFAQPPPAWPGRLTPRAWAAALWLREEGRLARSAGPVHGWDGALWRRDDGDDDAVRPAGQAASATRLALALLGTLTADPGRLSGVSGADGTRARLAA